MRLSPTVTAGIDAQNEYLRCLHPAYPSCAVRQKLSGTFRLACSMCTTTVPITPPFLEAP